MLAEKGAFTKTFGPTRGPCAKAPWEDRWCCHSVPFRESVQGLPPASESEEPTGLCSPSAVTACGVFGKRSRRLHTNAAISPLLPPSNEKGDLCSPRLWPGLLRSLRKGPSRSPSLLTPASLCSPVLTTLRHPLPPQPGRGQRLPHPPGSRVCAVRDCWPSPACSVSLLGSRELGLGVGVCVCGGALLRSLSLSQFHGATGPKPNPVRK